MKICNYCGIDTESYDEYFPHEGFTDIEHFCIFAPRNEIKIACANCSNKKCADCNNENPRFAFLECSECEKVHCFNLTDMKDIVFGSIINIQLCDAYKKCPLNKNSQ